MVLLAGKTPAACVGSPCPTSVSRVSAQKPEQLFGNVWALWHGHCLQGRAVALPTWALPPPEDQLALHPSTRCGKPAKGLGHVGALTTQQLLPMPFTPSSPTQRWRLLGKVRRGWE